MSYGQNAPWGLQATKSLNASTWNGQTNPYLIKTDTAGTGQPANSIFRGDPVIFNADGYIVSLFDLTSPTLRTAAILGVFDGCSYVTTTATNPIDPASPGRAYFPVGTVTLNNIPATAFVVDDPNTIFNVQTNATPGLGQTNMGNTAPVAFNPGAGLNGNTNTGISTVTLDQSAIGTAANLNLKLIRLVAITGNVADLGYNNAEVIIQNHFYCSRPVGV